MLTCTFEDGNQASLRHVTVDTLVLKDGKILLMKRAAQLTEGGKWGLAGGYVDRDETVREAAAREVLEESGYKISDLTFLTLRDSPERPREDRQNVCFVFFCNALEKVSESDWEVQEAQWFSLDELPPPDEVAFDHYANIELYKKYLRNGSLPAAL